MADTTSENSEKRTEHHEAGRGYRRRLQGRIVSDTANAGRAKKTVTVEVQRRYRDPVYQVMGRWLKGVFPVSTGVVVTALARPEWVVEIDATAVIPESRQS